MLFFRTAVADWYHVPSGSMQPNILIGDRVWVNKLAYDVKIPFSSINLNRHHEPQAGDVVVFQSEKAGERLIKRVVGVSGDRVSMNKNRLMINGKQVNTELLESDLTIDQFMQDREDAVYFKEKPVKSGYDNIAQSQGYPIRVSRTMRSSLDSFDETTIPEDYLLVLGDNRDNSADSRVIGLIPRSELVGRAERVVVSFDSDNYYLPRDGRYWQRL
ncbi:signal peptidase I [Aliikangiella coralliicola]|uniref:Signal peptidase I n=2 Tax=Aliikangiella coralliicola TaxID=2592383 RepID=A0A545UKA8_9GAMM|nr:signal peptidase I [Aliikangiella coralliicola]